MTRQVDHWPPHGKETRPWATAADAVDRGGRRPPIEDRLLTEIEISVPPEICGLTPVLEPTTVSALDGATATISRLDAGVGTELGALSGFLLRSEAVASSKVERIHADLNDVARAAVGVEAGNDARQTIAAAEAITELINRSVDGLTLDLVLQAHHRLLRDDPIEGATAGTLRTQQNWIGGSDFTPRGADFVPPNHERVPGLMEDLLAFAARRDLPPLAQAAIAHAQFESIHGFTDGNGRVGRALINGTIRYRGLTRHLAIPIASVMLADVDHYFDRLTDYRDGNVESLIRYVATAAGIAADAAGLSAAALAELPGRWRDAAGGPRRGSASAAIIGQLLATPVLTYKTAASIAQGSDRSAFTALDRLTEAGVLTEITGGRRDRVWIAGDVFDEVDRLQERVGRRVTPSVLQRGGD